MSRWLEVSLVIAVLVLSLFNLGFVVFLFIPFPILILSELIKIRKALEERNKNQLKNE